MNILTVDDDAVIRTTMCEILRREKTWSIVDADDGEVAWQMLDKGLDVDLCILDNVMPELTGIELIKRMRQDTRFKTMPIILVTMNRDRELVMEAVKNDVKDFILKPFKASRLIQQVRKVADRIPAKSKLSNEVLTDPEVVITRLEIDYVRYLKILELFITDLDKGNIDTRNLIVDGDILPALSRLDAMKGSCLTFGAHKFRNSVEKIDQLNESSLGSLEIALDELRETFDALKKEIGDQGLTSELTNLDSQTVPLGEGVQSVARAKILLIEDKPIIVRQIRENLVSNSWIVKSLNGPSDAMEYTLQNKVDLLIVSLSLPENGAFSLIRFLRSNARTRGVPVFGLSIKTAVDEQRKAQESGFNTIITKPINFADLKSNIERTLHIDMTSKYYRKEGEYFIINIPDDDIKQIQDMQKTLATKLAEVVEDGYGKVIIDALEVKEYHMETFELIGEALVECENLAVPCALAGTPQVVKTCQEIEDYKKWPVHKNLEEAKQSLSGNPMATTPV